MYISTESAVLNELSTLELCDKTTGISCQISLGLVMKRIKQCPIRFRNCPVGQLAEKSTSPSQKYNLSFLIIVKQGHSLKLIETEIVLPRLLVVSDDRTGPISSPTHP